MTNEATIRRNEVSSQNHYPENHHESSTSYPLVRNPSHTHRSSSASPDSSSTQSVSSILTPTAAGKTASPSLYRHLERTFSASLHCFRETDNRNSPAAAT